jgi:hypothetical protein
MEASDNADLCRLYGYIVNGKKEAIDGVTIFAVPYDSPIVIDDTFSIISPDSVITTTSSTGEFYIDLIQNAKFTISIPHVGLRKTIIVPSSTGPVVLWGLTDLFIVSDPVNNNPNW